MSSGITRIFVLRKFSFVNVAGQNPTEIPQVILIHEHDVIVMIVVGDGHLACRFSATVDAMTGEHASCGRVHRISYFFGASISSVLVAADAISKSAAVNAVFVVTCFADELMSRTNFFITNSAIGLRQMFP